MRKLLVFTLAICCSSFILMAHKETDAESIVKRYGFLLSSWSKCDTSDIQQLQQYEIKDRLDNELISKDPYFQISDMFVQELAKHNNIIPTNNVFLFETFMNWLEKEKRRSKTFKIEISNIKEIPRAKVNNPAHNKQYVKCKIKVYSQPNSFESSQFIDITSFDTIVVSNYMIEYITTYEGKDDSFWRKTWDEVLDSKGVGIAYEYSKNYPINASIAFSKSIFMLGLDFGKASEKNSISTKKVEFTDLLNYKITQGEYKPKCFITLTPSIYMKYISVGFGAGVLFLKGKTKIEGMSTEVKGDDIFSSDLNKQIESDTKTRLIMRPNLKLYVPCSNSFSIITSISYNWIWGSKNLNGLSYGIGIRYNIQ